MLISFFLQFVTSISTYRGYSVLFLKAALVHDEPADQLSVHTEDEHMDELLLCCVNCGYPNSRALSIFCEVLPVHATNLIDDFTMLCTARDFASRDAVRR